MVRLAARRAGGLPTTLERAYAGVLGAHQPRTHARRDRAARADDARRGGVPAFRADRPARLFSGRSDQIAELFSVVQQPGAHAVVYGERGVGKTSLAAVTRSCSRRATCSSPGRPATRATTSRRSGGRRSARSRCTPSRAASGSRRARRTSRAGEGGARRRRVTPHAVVRASTHWVGRGRSRSSSTSSTGSTARLPGALYRHDQGALRPRGPGDARARGRRRHGRRADPRAPLGRASIVQVRMPRMARDELAEIARRGSGRRT